MYIYIYITIKAIHNGDFPSFFGAVYERLIPSYWHSSDNAGSHSAAFSHALTAALHVITLGCLGWGKSSHGSKSMYIICIFGNQPPTKWWGNVFQSILCCGLIGRNLLSLRSTTQNASSSNPAKTYGHFHVYRWN